MVRTLLSKAAAFAERQTSLFDGVERIVDDFRPVRLPLRVGFRRTPKPWVQVCSFKLPRQLRLFSSLPEVFHGR